jgi:hypothetical protein
VRFSVELSQLTAGDGFWYVGTPYTKFEEGIDAAAEAACRVTGALMKEGVAVFSPIAHCHWIAKFSGIDPLDVDLWLEQQSPFIATARGLIVAMLPGWDGSDGVRHEIRKFAQASKPIVHFDPFYGQRVRGRVAG